MNVVNRLKAFEPLKGLFLSKRMIQLIRSEHCPMKTLVRVVKTYVNSDSLISRYKHAYDFIVFVISL
jgi:hypothetical protein